MPITAQAYTQYGLPWFALYDEEQGDVPAAETLSRVKTVREQELGQGAVDRREDEALDVIESQITKLHHHPHD